MERKAEAMYLLMKAAIRKSKKTSLAFFLLVMAAMLLYYTASQMTEGFQRLYREKIVQTDSADFAAVLPRSFLEKFGEELDRFLQEDGEVKEMEAAEALLLRSMDIQAGEGKPVNGSWTFRNADRIQTLSGLKIAERLERIPDNGIYVPYVCRTFFGFELGDTLRISSEDWQESFVIAGFTEDVLFGSRANLAFDLPEEAFCSLRERAGTDCDAVIVLVRTDGDVSGAANRFSEFVAARADDEVFYNFSDLEYAESSRSSNLSIYAALMKAASLIGIAACFMVAGFHMRSTLDRDLKELGILKAVGWGGGQIAAAYVLQFLLLGFLGAAAGVGISQCIMPAVIGNIATDVGFIWEPVFLGTAAGKGILGILVVIGAVMLFLSRGIFRLRPVEAFRDGDRTSFRRSGGPAMEKMPFPASLSVALKMIVFERTKSIMTCVILAVVMCVAGFAVILYARLVSDREGLVRITGAEVYSVNVQAARPEETTEIAKELEGAGVRRVMTAIEPGSSRLLCGDEVYAALGVYSDYEALENPSLYAGRYPKHENEAVISGNLAQLLGKEIGDTIEVSQIFQETPVQEPFLVVGFIQGTYTGGMDIYLTMEGLKRIDPAARWQTVHVYLEEGVDVEEYCQELKNSFSGRLSYAGAFEQVFYSQLAPVIDSVSGIVFLIMAVMALLLIIIGYFVTNSALLTRKTDFGIMKALGYSTGQIISQAVVTFMLYIAAGSIPGGILLYFGSDAVIAGLFRGMGVYRVEFSFPAALIAVLVLCLEGAGCLTAFISAWKVRKIVPCDLIKGE